MKIQLALAVSVLALAACSSTPTQTPVEIKEAGVTTPPPPTPTPPTNTGQIGNVTATGGETATPLKDFSVYFDLDKYDVAENQMAVVRAHANYMQKNPTKKASVQGNTDERGSREYNLSLGQKRAESVKKLLVTMGAKEAQIEAVSFGEEKPKATGRDESAWAQNRRSDITYPQ